MNQEFLIVLSNYTEVSRFSHCVANIKQMPYKDSTDSARNLVKAYFRDILLPFPSIRTAVELGRYHLLENMTQEEIDNRYRLLDEMNVIRQIKKNFIQLSQLADIGNVAYGDLSKKIQDLEDVNSKLLTPVRRSVDYTSELSLLVPYLVKTKNSDAHQPYQEMLEELNQEYKDVLSETHFPEVLAMLQTENNKNIIEFKVILDDLLERIREQSPEVVATMSTKYTKELNNSSGDISQFLLDKTFDEDILTSIKLEDHQKVQAYLVFKDNSIAVKQKGVFKEIDTMDDLDETFNALKESIVSFKLKKRPQIAKFFIALIKENGQFDKGLLAIETFIKNEQILKNMKMDLNAFKEKNFEALDDYMNSLIDTYKLNQYANSILSNKNKHLLTDNCLSSFKILRNMEVSETQLQDIIGKKMAAIKTSEEFENYLTKVVGQFTGFNHEALSSKLDRAGITPVYDEGDVVVFPVKEYKDSKSLGSPSWCIVRNDSYFDSYTSHNQKQYFLYDFNKTEKENDSLIGFTLTENGDFHTQHLRNDDYFNVNTQLQDIANKIMFNNKDEFKLSPEKLKALDEVFMPKNKKQSNKQKQGL